MEYYNSFSMVEQEYEEEVDHVVGGFDEGRINWLPAHVLDHHQEKPSQLIKQSAYRRPDHHHQHRRPKISLPAHSIPRYDDHQQHSFSKSSSPTLYHHHRPRFPISSTSSRVSSAGPGMQAVFLDSGRRTSSCGTGFFLPQRAAGNTTFQPNKKSACSPVLLPSRVVQVLNLNVHELACSQFTPRRDPDIKKLRDNNRNQDSSSSSSSSSSSVVVLQQLLNNKNGRDDIGVVALDQSSSSSVNSTLCSVASQTRSSSPEIFLPKEWTY